MPKISHEDYHKIFNKGQEHSIPAPETKEFMSQTKNELTEIKVNHAVMKQDIAHIKLTQDEIKQLLTDSIKTNKEQIELARADLKKTEEKIYDEFENKEKKYKGMFASKMTQRAVYAVGAILLLATLRYILNKVGLEGPW